MLDRREVTLRCWRAAFLILASLTALTWAFAGILNPAMSQLHAFVSEYSARDQPWRYLFQTTDVIMGTSLCLAGLATLAWAGRRPLGRQGWSGIGFVAGGLFSVLDALVTMDCSPYPFHGLSGCRGGRSRQPEPPRPRRDLDDRRRRFCPPDPAAQLHHDEVPHLRSDSGMGVDRVHPAQRHRGHGLVRWHPDGLHRDLAAFQLVPGHPVVADVSRRRHHHLPCPATPSYLLRCEGGLPEVTGSPVPRSCRPSAGRTHQEPTTPG